MFKLKQRVEDWLKTPNGQKVYHWVVSTVTTFLSGFIIVLGFEIDNINTQSIEAGALVGIFLAAVRGGVKALIQALSTWYLKNK